MAGFISAEEERQLASYAVLRSRVTDLETAYSAWLAEVNETARAWRAWIAEARALADAHPLGAFERMSRREAAERIAEGAANDALG